jgi:hypothetical protein
MHACMAGGRSNKTLQEGNNKPTENKHRSVVIHKVGYIKYIDKTISYISLKNL